MITDISFSIAYLRWSKIDTPETSKIGKNFQKIIYMDQIKHLKIIRHESEKRLVDERFQIWTDYLFQERHYERILRVKKLEATFGGELPLLSRQHEWGKEEGEEVRRELYRERKD